MRAKHSRGHILLVVAAQIRVKLGCFKSGDGSRDCHVMLMPTTVLPYLAASKKWLTVLRFLGPVFPSILLPCGLSYKVCLDPRFEHPDKSVHITIGG